MGKFIGHIVGFGMMFGVAFVGLSTLLLILPAIVAFIVWDPAPLVANASSIMLCVRFVAVAATLIGLAFTLSREGSDLAEYIKDSWE